MKKLKVYEVQLAGFNGGTDGTDNEVVWVAAPSRESVLDLCTRMKIDFDFVEPTEMEPDVAGIDFVINEKESSPQALKHTPGPWRYSRGNAYFQKSGRLVITELIFSKAGAWIAAVIRGDSILTDAQEANAKLIAAAPDLLEVAKGYLSAHDLAARSGQLSKALDCGFSPDLMGDAREAIEKATP